MLEPAEIFTLAFVMLGPLKLLGPFVQRTRGLPDDAVRAIAFWAFVMATIAIVAGGLFATILLAKWSVSVPALTLAGGILFFLIALRMLLDQYGPGQAPAQDPLPASPVAAATQLVFPSVLTPYGIAGVIALLARSQSTPQTLAIVAILVAVMVLNLLAMLYARRILVGAVPMILQLVGAVLAVLQVALSVQFIVNALQSLHVIPA